MNKLRIMIDASCMKSAGCSLRWFNQVVLGYRTPVNTVQIEIGQAFHKFRAHFRVHGLEGFGDAVQLAVEYFKKVKYTVPSHKKYMTEDYLVAMCGEYATTYSNDKLKPVPVEDDYAIELPFCLPYYVDDTLEVLLSGTMDEVSQLDQSVYVITDCKVTSLWDIDEFLDDFLLSGQLLFYRYIVSLYGKEFPDTILGDISRSNPCLLIDCVNTKGKAEIKCVRSKPWMVSEQTLIEYEMLLHKKIKEFIGIVKYWQATGVEPAREGMLTDVCDGKYAKCAFFTSCCMPEGEGRKMWLDSRLIKRAYNPMEFGGNS